MLGFPSLREKVLINRLDEVRLIYRYESQEDENPDIAVPENSLYVGDPDGRGIVWPLHVLAKGRGRHIRGIYCPRH